MILRIGASLLLVAAISIGCGKYGPPERVKREEAPPDPAAQTDGGESSEEDSEAQQDRP